MKRLSMARISGEMAVAGAVALTLYLLFVRRWHLRWGTTDEEIALPMPLDDRIPRPTYVTHRAITIDARPEEIWPWLAQMGELPRGGFYSYEWIERLMGMKVENAERILPEFQHLQTGDVLDRSGGMQVKAVEPNRFVVLGPPEGNPDFASTWAIAIYPLNRRQSRLVSRVRAHPAPTPMGLFWLLLLDPGQFIMERKMLLEIKRRVEAADGQRHEYLAT